MLTRPRTSFALALLAIVGSGASAVGDTLTPRQKSDLAIEARRVLKKYCGECHEAAGSPAFQAFPVMDFARYSTNPVPVPFANRSSPRESLLLQLLEDGSMPPGGRPRPADAEIATVRKWITAGSLAYPPNFSEETALEEIAAYDKAQITEKPEAAGSRYVSFRHLFSDTSPTPSMEQHLAEFQKAMVAAAGVPEVPLKPIDDVATIFRVDVGKIGWTMPDLFEKVVEGKSDGAADFNGFDLLLLEYPFASPSTPAAKEVLSRRSQVRPIPYLRGDWVTSVLRRDEKLTPLAVDLRSVTRLSQAPDDPPGGPKLQMFVGARASHPREVDIRQGRVASLLSGVSVTDVIPDAPPFELKLAYFVTGNPVESLTVTTQDKFRIVVTASKDVHLLLLWIQADGECVVQPLNVHQAEKETAKHLTPKSDRAGFKIASILTGGKTATEYAILYASEQPLPLPTMIRSRHLEDLKHDKGRIWRFVFPNPLMTPDGNASEQTSNIIRRVIPIEVHEK